MRIIGIVAALLGILSLLIVIPAAVFGATGAWQVRMLAAAYFTFFLLNVLRRDTTHGKLAKRDDDEQVKSVFGRIGFATQIFGLLAVHWLALYDFSTDQFSSLRLAAVPASSVAAIFLVTAIVLSEAATRQLGRFFDRLVIKEGHELITTGVYSQVRHPIYTSYILLFIGFVVMLQSLVSIGLLAVVCAVWFGSRIQIEEAMLEKKFGGEYKSYREKTKRLLPFIY